MSRIALLSLAFCSVAALWSCNAVETPSVEAELAPLETTETQDLPAGFELATLVRLEKRQPIEAKGLHNVFVLSENISSGSEPEGREAFARLQELGIKTILSVDGKQPNTKIAAEFGMKYVHVPIQYKGIDQEALVHITKSFRELQGPFYVHCFHGRHRGPAAAAVGRLVLDNTSREEALAEMRQWFGTSQKYEGLYSLIARGAIPTAEESSASTWVFESSHSVDGIAGAMVPIARSHDALRILSKNNWEIDPNHPDIDPVNEASILLEAFESMEILSEVSDGPDQMQKGSADSITAARSLRNHLLEVRRGSKSAAKAAMLNLKQVNAQCSSCHATYRNR
ncbi:MAG: protein tyrosine phosphatase (PTP) superfamily phosphohydrolase (DUF442 family) [Planctomycetota bacterium]|jgi:protein tyrosine phosphatase (PTP) superfamily phosphohydrolase (DUF442 family)